MNTKHMLLKYICGYDVYQFEMDTNNKIIEPYLILGQVYNNIIHNSFKFKDWKYDLTTFFNFLGSMNGIWRYNY
jgi:hypothetical protein